MRTLRLLIAALITPALALGQTTMDYRPFRPGHTHTYQTDQAPPELRTVRLGAGELVGADSVYHFVPAYREFDHATDTLAASCPSVPGGAFAFSILDYNTPFGAELWLQPGGDYVLRFTRGRTVRFLSRGLAVGNSWVMCFNPYIQATVARRTVLPVGTAQVPDSVVVLTLSTGDSVRLSKSFGLLTAPDLGRIGAFRQERLQLLTIPERGLGELPNSVTYDWQPGDSLHWTRSEYDLSTMFTCASWATLSVYLTRTASPGGDTIRYTGITHTARTVYGVPMCAMGPAGTTFYPPTPFDNIRVVDNNPRRRGLLLGQITLGSGQTGGYVNVGAYYLSPAATCVPGWRYRYTRYYDRDTCQQTLVQFADNGDSYEEVPGFGIVATGTAWTGGGLDWIRRNGQSCGNRPTGSVLLAMPALLPERAVHLYPNPATESARLSLTTTKGGPLTLTVTDALGRLTWRHQTTIGADAEVALPTASWPRGVYLVRVQLPEGARTLRLVRE